jgi:hypothetical protein
VAGIFTLDLAHHTVGIIVKRDIYGTVMSFLKECPSISSVVTEADNNHYDRLSILQRPTIDFVFHHTKPPPHIKKSEPDKKKQRSN